MNKIYGLILLLAFTLQLKATETLIEAKGAYLYLTHHKMREIYGPVGQYGLETSISLWRSWYLWASGDVFHNDGKSLGFHQSTDITVVPVGFGIKYLRPINERFDWYAGIGPQYSYLHIHNHSSYVTQHIDKWGWGAIGKGGFLLNLYKGIFLDIFGQYSYLNIHFNNSLQGKVSAHDAHLSGWLFGGAIGYRFGSNCCNNE